MSTPSTTQLTKNEVIKLNDPTLSGTIGETMANPDVDRFPEDDEQFLKFHGIYQQDDRDKRKTGKQYLFMIRARLTAGIVPAAQYLAFDDLADRYGNQSLRITSRQSFQWHGVVKKGLGPLMKGLNDALCSTIAACGDVNRNVMAPSTPSTSVLVEQVYADSQRVSDALLPQTRAYHEIWVNGEHLKLNAEEKRAFEDPLYGKSYLPRKFKVAFAIPPLNDTDVFTNCLGFVAVVDTADSTKLIGYNVLCGGGLGMSHNNKETFPRVSDVMGFVTPDKIAIVARSVVAAYRDSGDRTNRKHARLKYVIADRGIDWFRSEVEARAGFKLEAPKPFKFERQGDMFGWHRQTDGRSFLGLYVEAGRISDTPKRKLKTALRRIVSQYQTEVRLTPSQNLLLANVAPESIAGISAILQEYGIPVENQAAAVRRASMACVSLPTCGLALAESERIIPSVLDRIEGLLGELGLSDEEIIVRMTGCPNGCARPYMAEIGFVGRAPGKYNLYLGGNHTTTRLNTEYKASMKIDEVSNELRPVLSRWKDERLLGERFGDFCSRVILPEHAAALAAAAASTPPPLS